MKIKSEMQHTRDNNSKLIDDSVTFSCSSNVCSTVFYYVVFLYYGFYTMNKYHVQICEL